MAVIGGDLRPAESVDRYLAWLSHVERSPNTVRAYACDLKLFVTFLTARGLVWDRVSLEALGEFTAWLRSLAENVLTCKHDELHRVRMLDAAFAPWRVAGLSTPANNAHGPLGAS